MRWSSHIHFHFPHLEHGSEYADLCGALCIPTAAIAAIVVVVMLLFQPAPEKIGVRSDFGTAEIAEMSR